MSLFDLSGQRALVSGASRGLGLQMAGAPARAGADLVITARDVASLEEPRRQLESCGNTVECVALDLQHEESIQAAVETATATGHLDILVNNVGQSELMLPENVDSSVWQKQLDLNLNSAMMACRVALPQMI